MAELVFDNNTVRREMIEEALRDLRFAFQRRPKPQKWVRDDLHPVYLLDATDFVRDIEAGKDRALLFQSAIPYFAFLTNEARVFLLPDYLGTITKYESFILSAVCDLDDERGKALLSSLTPAEQAAVRQFIAALSQSKDMQFYSEDIAKLAHLVDVSQTIR